MTRLASSSTSLLRRVSVLGDASASSSTSTRTRGSHSNSTSACAVAILALAPTTTTTVTQLLLVRTRYRGGTNTSRTTLRCAHPRAPDIPTGGPGGAQRRTFTRTSAVRTSTGTAQPNNTASVGVGETASPSTDESDTLPSTSSLSEVGCSPESSTTGTGTFSASNSDPTSTPSSSTTSNSHLLAIPPFSTLSAREFLLRIHDAAFLKESDVNVDVNEKAEETSTTTARCTTSKTSNIPPPTPIPIPLLTDHDFTPLPHSSYSHHPNHTIIGLRAMSPKITIPDGSENHQSRRKAKAHARRKAKILNMQEQQIPEGGRGSTGPRNYYWVNHRGVEGFEMPPSNTNNNSNNDNTGTAKGTGTNTNLNKDILYIRDHLLADRALAELHASLRSPSTFSNSVFFNTDAATSPNSNSNSNSTSKPVLGFDLEWRPRFTALTAAEARRGVPRENPVALVQLATREKVWLVQVCAMTSFPKRLAQILEDEDILKCGVGILGDAQKLFREQGVQMRGCVELSYLARTADPGAWLPPPPPPAPAPTAANVDVNANMKPVDDSPSFDAVGDAKLQQIQAQLQKPHHKKKSSKAAATGHSTNSSSKMALIALARLVVHYTGESLPKGRVQMSNWGAPLSGVQQTYAANDAHCAQTIYALLKTAERAHVPNVDQKWRAHYTFNIRAGKPVLLGGGASGSAQGWAPKDPYVSTGEGSASGEVVDFLEDEVVEGEAGGSSLITSLSLPPKPEGAGANAVPLHLPGLAGGPGASVAAGAGLGMRAYGTYAAGSGVGLGSRPSKKIKSGLDSGIGSGGGGSGSSVRSYWF
ncbi:hypothetical protein SCHPADRAFT_923648 [Schizopora paradoxa]|uniref:3'-5' exonuclease domain-containing protein n=1 Tax=Schizopora paradoxa TaxID=27342 RepID=A0A0H2STR4_9AGAM|nr:hypothetical protein SCHPADRAFT_923648 [Schizopora paradoxa]